MDLSTILGLLLGGALLIWAVVIGGDWRIFIHPGSILIVFGGTFMGTVVNYSLRDLIELVKYTGKAFKKGNYDPNDIIEIMVGFAEKARREGLLALEDEANELDNEFLKKGIQLVVDGTDPELVKNIMVTRLNFAEAYDQNFQDMYKYMSNLGPAYGMLGTLIGLIQMLSTLDDPSQIAGGMATAIITTLYGSFLANYVFIPIAGKLRVRSSEEILLKELMIEGLLSIQAGENPRIVEEKLKAFLGPTQAKKVEEEDDKMAVGLNG